MENSTLEKIFVIIQVRDGSYHQVLLDDEQEVEVNMAILNEDGSITALEDKLELDTNMEL